MIKDIVIPEIGENVESGTVVAVLVAVNDQVEQDDGIIEFETDKAVVEIPSPGSGKIVEILVEEGQELKIGAVVARLETAEETGAKAAPDKNGSRPASEEAATQPAPSEPAAADRRETDGQEDDHTQPEADPPPDTQGGVSATAPSAETEAAQDGRLPLPAAPSVRRFAREVGVDLQAVQGSGPGGRISENDVKAHLKSHAPAERGAESPPEIYQTEAQLPDFSRWGNIKAVDISTVRRLTAESMTRSWQTVPQVTQFDEADISDLNRWMETSGRTLAKQGGRLTITAVLLKVIAQGLKRFPRFNASLDMTKQQIILKDYIHIGLAVATDRGLLVPVIRDVVNKSISELAVEMEDVVDRARRKKLPPDEMEGGTFTLSNQGGIGGVAFTPIVYWPQAAILGVSRATVAPRYRDGDWQPRTILPLCLSYDHRINDGADAAGFLRWIGNALTYPMELHL